MFRRTFILPKVTRSWTNSSISAASAHFPDAVRVDPATLRDGSTSAKEVRHWTLMEGRDGAERCGAPARQLSSAIHRIKCYGELVRFTKPVGWQLLLMPCYWGSSLAVTRALVWDGADPVVLCAPFFPIHLAFFFLVGAYAMRSVGCIVNDMWDRKIDQGVERTRLRPLASGAVSMKEASLVLMVHLSLAGVVALNLSPAALAASLAITPIWIIYPLMKRVTYAPQFFLGLCFNWGIFVGYAAVLGRVDLAVCLPIYAGAVVWTILYDTIYAYQDRQDDLKCGVKSTAIWIGDRKYILNAMIGPIGLGLLVSGLMVSQSLPYYIGCLMCMYHLHSIVDDVNIYDGWSCARGFKRNVHLGLGVLLTMCLGNAFWAIASEHEGERDAESDSLKKDSLLQRFLFLDQRAEARLYDAESFNWVDRFVHPSFVQAEAAKAKGQTEPPAIPAWMRREYIGQNVSSILRFCGVSEEKIGEWSQWWYSSLDHYNMFSRIQI